MVEFRWMQRYLLVGLTGLLAFAGSVSCGDAASEREAAYGTRVKYRPGEKIEFPDFTIEYVGKRKKSVPLYPSGFFYYDFKLSKGNVGKIVSWTSGTGDIAPANFEIGGNHYQLELRHSDNLGKLRENEFVIWKTAAAADREIDARTEHGKRNVIRSSTPSKGRTD